MPDPLAFLDDLTPRKKEKTMACIVSLQGFGGVFGREDAESAITLALSATQRRTAKEWLKFLTRKKIVRTAKTGMDGMEFLELNIGR